MISIWILDGFYKRIERGSVLPRHPYGRMVGPPPIQYNWHVAACGAPICADAKSFGICGIILVWYEQITLHEYKSSWSLFGAAPGRPLAYLIGCKKRSASGKDRRITTSHPKLYKLGWGTLCNLILGGYPPPPKKLQPKFHSQRGDPKITLGWSNDWPICIKVTPPPKKRKGAMLPITIFEPFV